MPNTSAWPDLQFPNLPNYEVVVRNVEAGIPNANVLGDGLQDRAQIATTPDSPKAYDWTIGALGAAVRGGWPRFDPITLSRRQLRFGLGSRSSRVTISSSQNQSSRPSADFSATDASDWWINSRI